MSETNKSQLSESTELNVYFLNPTTQMLEKRCVVSMKHKLCYFTATTESKFKDVHEFNYKSTMSYYHKLQEDELVKKKMRISKHLFNTTFIQVPDRV